MTPSPIPAPRRFRALLLPLTAVALPLHGVEIRSYNPADHDRFTGFPASPVVNPGFLFDGSRFTGVGWQVENTNRQFALVSRRHVVFATHNTPNLNVSPGLVVRFLNASGATVDRVLASKVAVADPVTLAASDLTLITLSAPIDAAEGVEPLPFLDLADEPAYVDEDLAVFGLLVKAGRSRIGGFADISGTGLLPSRVLSFDYLDAGTDPDDAKLQGGDSGSPSFVLTAGGGRALVGTHSAIDPITRGPNVVGQTNYDTFVPHYVESLDALMAPLGYRMRPLNAPSTTLAGASSTLEATPRRGNPLTLVLELSNTGANLTGNLEVELAFPAGQEPDSVGGAGWVSHGSGAFWTLRRATLAAGANSTVSATWSGAPAVASLTPTLTWRSDTVGDQSVSPVIALGPSFAEWADAEGLVEDGQGDDPDGDEIVNLLEYAFGGDPLDGLAVNANGDPLLPRLVRDGSEALLRFPERDDKVQRGLEYVVEFSSDLVGWTTVSPSGTTSLAEPFTPAIPGLVERQVRWPLAGPATFARVGVVLDE